MGKFKDRPQYGQNMYYDYDSDQWLLFEGFDEFDTTITLPEGYVLNGEWPTKTESDTCEHEWARYDSGFKAFDYCKKCNIEREEIL